MKAFLKNYRQSPRKVRLVADLIKGKEVSKAMIQLDFLVKRASDPIKKLLTSAVANAKEQEGFSSEELYVKELRVDKGLVMKRMMPRAMGRGARINKRTSHVTLVLANKNNKPTKKSKANKTETKAKKAPKVSKVAEKKLTKKTKEKTSEAKDK